MNKRPSRIARLFANSVVTRESSSTSECTGATSSNPPHGRSKSSMRQRTRRRLHAEGLEARRLLAAYVVDTVDDSTAVDGLVSLREAIEAANTNSAVGDAIAGEGAATDTITFAAGLSAMTITLGSELSIVDSLDISLGAGENITVDGGGNGRVFSVGTGSTSVSISGITLSGGVADNGGAILVAAGESLVLDGVTLTSNEANGDAATEGGGALFNDGGSVTITNSTISGNVASGAAGSGGGLMNFGGTLMVSNTTIDSNVANRAGGGIESTTDSTNTLTDVTLSNNNAGVSPAVARPGNGGGMHLSGNAGVTITGGLITNNTAAQEGGGLWNSTATMTIDGTTISGNTASGDAADDGGGAVFNNGGSVDISNATMQDNAADGVAGSGGAILNLGGTLVVTASEISQNEANRAGGGIEATAGTINTLTNVTLDDNVAGIVASPGNGGGLHITGAGDATVTGGTVSGNLAANEGGGLWNGSGTMMVSGGTQLSNNTAGNDDADNGGGAIFNSGGIVNVSGATISGNMAVGTRGSGGGILNVDGGSLTVSTTTISGNSADGILTGDGGGGILSIDGTVTISDSDILENTADGIAGSGGGILSRGGQLTITDTVIAGNLANRAGGGIELGSVLATLTDVTLGGTNPADGNSVAFGVPSPGNGGGLHVSADSAVTIVRGSVQNNTAIEGGGLWNSSTGQMTITGTTITQNIATRGGGIHNDAGSSTADQLYSLNFTPLNTSGVSGTGNVTVSSPTATTRTIRVVIHATGLEDLSGIPGAIHVAHIHGQFAGNADRPILEQGDGVFFDGTGGTGNAAPPTASVAPSLGEDDGRTVADGFLDFLEGRPKYGPVLLNLTSTQMRDAAPNGSNPPAGVPPLTHFLSLAGSSDIDPAALFPNGTDFTLDTTYTFDLTDPDEARQFANLSPLSLREIVLHGQSIDKAVSDAIDAATMGTAPGGVDLGNGMAFRVTAPVAVAEVQAVGGRLTITDATISGNEALENGGGILNEAGDVHLVDTDLMGNSSGADEPGEGGGAIFSGGTMSIAGGTIDQNTAIVGLGNGGGILNTGTLRVTGTAITANSAARAGGGIENSGTLELFSTTLGNNVTGINGGGLHVSDNGVVTIADGAVTGNTAGREGGGLWNNSSLMTVDGTTLSGNTASGDAADDGGGAIFNNGGTLMVRTVTIINNTADGASGSGGGIMNLGGTLLVDSSSITNNVANRAGGGIESTSGSSTSLTDVTLSANTAGPSGSAAPGSGGGLHVTGAGSVSITGTTVAGNVAASEGGGLWNGSARMTLSDVIISGNTASGDAFDQGGGGVFNSSGTVRIDDQTRIEGNVADGAAGSGGGILNDAGGTLIVADSIIRQNIANRAGGGIETGTNSTVVMTDVTLDQNQAGTAPATAAPGNGGGLHVSGSGDVTIIGGIVSDNQAASEGGGLWNGSGRMIVDGTTVSQNTASGNAADQGGGGLFNEAGELIVRGNSMIIQNVANGTSGSGGGILNNVGASLVIQNSEVSSNAASRAGGGIEDNAGSSTTITNSRLTNNTAASSPGNGGALHVTGAGNVSIVSTTVAGNTASNEGGGLWNSAVGIMSVSRSTLSGNEAIDGGGIFGDGAGGSLSVVNTTISDNTAMGKGGGMSVEGGALTLIGVTVAQNAAAVGGGINYETTSAIISNSILATNTATTNPNGAGALASGGNNLFGDPTGLIITGSTDPVDVDPLLGPLSDNGGPTLTHALLAGSPALDAGAMFGLTQDQRGVARPQGPAIDIGAFESSLAAPLNDGDIDANDSAPGSAGDSAADSFNVTFDAVSNVYVVTVNGNEVQRVAPGTVSVIRITGSSDNDTVTINDGSAASPGTPPQNFEILGFGGDDTVTINSLNSGNSVSIDGGDGNDTVNVGDAFADTAVAGTVMVSGGSQSGPNRRIRTGGLVSPNNPYDATSQYVESTPASSATGDTLNVHVRSASTSQKVSVDMVDQTITRSFIRLVSFEGFETIGLATGEGDDSIEVRTSAAGGNVLTVDGRGGDDVVSVLGTTGNDALLVQSIMTDATARTSTEVGNVEFLFIDGQAGNDVIINDAGGGSVGTSPISVLSGGAGDDILIGGNRTDAIFGGDGTDAILGGAGDDFLFTDHDPDGQRYSSSGELILTGSGSDRGVGIDGDVVVGQLTTETTDGGISISIFPQSDFPTASLADVDALIAESFSTLAGLGFDFPLIDGPATDLGEVDFQLLEGLSLSNRTTVQFALTARQAGTLTVETVVGSDTDGPIRFVLLDDQGRFLAVATPQAGNERLDIDVTAGQAVRIAIYGGNTDFDLRINNLVSGTMLPIVAGTAGDDVFELMTIGNTANFSVNGTTYSRQLPAGEQIEFLSSGGEDQLRLSASDGMARVLKQGNSVAAFGDQIAALVRGIPIVEVLVGDLRPLLQNPLDRFDVTGDGQVTALDALRIINYLDRSGIGPISDVIERIDQSILGFINGTSDIDVNGDNAITALDALQVINRLGVVGGPGSEQVEFVIDPGQTAIDTLFGSDDDEDDANADGENRLF
ncbi:putative outer membrane protein PmpB precursor [Rubripirellula lacrimiformis]|uniref:Putative outer membrane protein PmpB n=1 Tax=Rubripirellula lacrimiformis TaxID=1930273 RepID=A0A517NC92_9BACT|nr:right-handed parallel beta-helix repeat-containing protein [Rubripirellula lacrimiformis]QDT04721.1 putative outer membrane protein PmpB precursor [Rubripirellula lacrimiformis]